MVRKEQKIVEILPAKPPSFQPKKQMWLDMRKTCLDCGYLEIFRRYDFERTKEGNLTWREERTTVTNNIRNEILKEGKDRWDAKNFRCYRGLWDATFGDDINKRVLRGLEEATKKRVCSFFFPWSIGDSPEIHRELHRERIASRRIFLAVIVGALIGGILTLVGSILVNLYLLH